MRFIAEKELATKAVTTVLDDVMQNDSWLYVVYPQKRYLPAKVRLFIDYLVDWFKAYAKQRQ